jgi:hypothetical protein
MYAITDVPAGRVRGAGAGAMPGTPPPAPPVPVFRPPDPAPRTLAEQVAELERRVISEALAATGGNRTAAADDLRKVLAIEAPGIDLDRVATALRALESEP